MINIINYLYKQSHFPDFILKLKVSISTSGVLVSTVKELSVRKKILCIIPGICDQSVAGKKGVPTAFQRMEMMMKKLQMRKQMSLI